MARGGGRGPGTSPRRPASSRPASRARSPRASRATQTGGDSASGASRGKTAFGKTALGKTALGKTALGRTALGKAAEGAAANWRGRLTAARGNRRTVRRAVLAVVALFLVILVGPTLNAYVKQRSDISALRDKVAQQKVTVEELKKEQARWTDPAYVEQQARTRLKFVKVGEKSYTVLDPKVRDTSGSIAHSTDSTEPWYDTIWSSMQAADVPANQHR